MRVIPLITLIFCVASSATSQLKYGTFILDKLCSPEFDGRGYINDGDKKAAKFIAKELENSGVSNFGGTYFQEFQLDVNTFPDSMRITVDGNTLKPGEAYIVDGNSGSSQGNMDLIWIDNSNFKNIELRKKGHAGDFKNKAIFVIDTAAEGEDSFKEYRTTLAYEFSNYSAVFIVNNGKFTWSVGRQEASNAIVEIRSDLIRNAKKVSLNIRNEFVKNYTTQNVIGYVKGQKKKAKKYVVFTAHYDHLGRMGSDTYFPGANDNASGVAMLLNLARHYSEHNPEHSVAFMFFGAEEAGILGSKYYTEHPYFSLDKIDFLINLDIFGTGDEGIKVVNATKFPKEFKRLKELNSTNDYLASVQKRGESANSDHHWFYQQGVPAIFIYTLGGIKAYHDIYDRSETLPLTEFEDLSTLLRLFADSF